jgi:hypothetical protein
MYLYPKIGFLDTNTMMFNGSDKAVFGSQVIAFASWTAWLCDKLYVEINRFMTFIGN